MRIRESENPRIRIIRIESWEVEVGVEVGGVDAGVGAAAADDGDGLAEEGGEGLLEGLLHGGQVGLGLPAAVVGAVVCQVDEISHAVVLFRRPSV